MTLFKKKEEKKEVNSNWLKNQSWKQEAIIALEEKITAMNKLYFHCQLQKPELN